MTEQSTKMAWPFPSANEDPWYTSFTSFVNAMDVSAYAFREDRHAILMGGGTVTWDETTGTVTWSEAIRISSPITGFQWSIAAGSAQIAEGSTLSVTLNRGPLSVSTVTASVASTVASTDGAFALATRYNGSLWWRNGVMMNDGDSLPSLGSLAAHAPTSVSMAHNETLSTSVPGPIIVGGTTFDAGRFVVAGILRFAMVGRYTATGTVGSCVVRVYDRGAPGAPVAGDLRSTVTIPFSSAGNLDAFSAVLSVVPAPGVGIDEISDTLRVYEAEAEIVGSDGAADIFKIHKVSFEVL